MQMNSTAVPLNRTIYAETRNETWALIDAGTTGIYGPIEDVSLSLPFHAPHGQNSYREVAKEGSNANGCSLEIRLRTSSR
jgi:hypothetical protein